MPVLCTKCGGTVKPVVAVDIDGTLGDYHRHFQMFAEEWLGHSLPLDLDGDSHYDGRQPYRDWFCHWYGVDVTTFRTIKLAYRQGGLKRTMPVYEEAAKLVGGLRSRAEVWLTTTRPWERYDRVDPDTREWLRRNGISYDALLFDENKMHQLYHSVDPGRVVAVLDDEPVVLEYVVRGVPLLLRTAYNYEARWEGPQVSSLSAAELIIQRLITKWHEENQ